jgi:hypothetical protein
MIVRAFLARLWSALSKPREPLPQLIRRRRAVERALASAGEGITPGNMDYDSAIRDYLALWLAARTEEEHYLTARERFGLDEDEADFLDQVLYSASLGTLANWANSQNNPWWQAAWRLSRSRHRHLLRSLRKELG